MSVSLRSTKETSPRPPRLQPSPSLPNLRVRNPSSFARPQPTPNKLSSHLPPLAPSAHPSLPSFKPDDSHHNGRSSKHAKNQHYLTPPLTPASSLKSDSTDADSSDPNPPTNDNLVPLSNDLPSGDVQQTRFLIIGNVPNDLSEDVIGSYFHFLASLDDSTPGSGIPAPQGKSSTAQTIQTIYYRFQENRAIVVAFYDARDADRVKRHIDAKSSLSHHDRNHEASWKEALTCLFVAPDHFLKLLGRSAAVSITRNEGSFYVSVGDMINVRDHDRSSSLSSWGRIRFTVPVKLKSVLAKFGELKSFLLMEADEGNHSQLFMVEYYDIRAAEAAWESLNGRVVENMKLRLIQKHALRDGGSRPRDFEKEEAENGGIEGHLGDQHAAEPKTPTTTTYLSQSQATSSSNAVPFPVLNDVASNDYRCEPERSHNDSSSGSSALNGCSLPISERQKPSLYPLDKYASITTDSSFTDSSHSRCGTFASDQFGRRGSNNLFFDAVRSRAPYKRVDPDLSSMDPTGIDVAQVGSLDTGETASDIADTYSTSYSSAQPTYGRDYFTHGDQYAADVSTPAPWVSPPAVAHNTGPMQYPVPSQSPMSCSSMVWDPLTGNWITWPPHNIVAEQWSTYQSPYYPLASHAVPYAFPHQSPPPVPVHPYGPSHRVYPPTYPSSPRTPPENNQLDIRKIEQGLDTRTTVMVKNIPNKMTDKELIAYINKVCPRRIDFLYLRMDFQNGCNVGYAFVNFINVVDLLTFAKLKLNEKWNMYSSEKVLQMSYANYQGKEALVEKFKNSCIMDEREEWRPKIFYSEPGPKQGLPEEFPKPTHMRRKERSSYNRGALFVPGINSGAAHYSPGKTFLNANSPNQRNSPNRPSFQGDERRQRRAYHGSPAHGDVDVSDEDGPRQR